MLPGCCPPLLRPTHQAQCVGRQIFLARAITPPHLCRRLYCWSTILAAFLLSSPRYPFLRRVQHTRIQHFQSVVDHFATDKGISCLSLAQVAVSEVPRWKLVASSGIRAHTVTRSCFNLRKCSSEENTLALHVVLEVRRGSSQILRLTPTYAKLAIS